MALQALKRKKAHEKQLEHIDGVLNTIQHQKGSLENASMNSGVFNAISNAAKALKIAHNEMNVDKVLCLLFFFSKFNFRFKILWRIYRNNTT